VRRIVLSRKGLDASWGGCPSPILPDGRLAPLPIPEPAVRGRQRRGDLAPSGADAAQAGVPYTQLQVPGHRSAAALLRALGRDAVVHPAAAYRGERGATVRVPLHRARAHLDPDLMPTATARAPGWRPAFGQVGGAQSHLAARGVGAGDLLLFFGWFRATRREGRRLRWTGPDLHVLWGWLEIEAVVPVDETTALPWAHPHLDGAHLARYGQGNTLYLATDRCSLDPRLPGAGALASITPARRLTAAGATRSVWDLPAALHPSATPEALSWHRPERWSEPDPTTGRVILRSAARGQEFVVGATDSILDWVCDVLRGPGRPPRPQASGSEARAASAPCPCSVRS
jgi:hypothetical protein